MKKIPAAVCAILLCAAIFSACAAKKTGSAVNVAVIKGPSSIGLIQFMNESDHEKSDNFAFSLYPNADEIITNIVQGNIDIAAVPANMASVLYNNTQGGVLVIAIGTLGIMYVVENGNSIESIEDLAGKTVYAGFKGKSPEYDLNYILSANGINPENDLTIEWKSEHSECVAALAATENSVAVLPQPFVTAAQSSNDNITIAADLNAEWNKLQEVTDSPSALVTGVVIVRKEFAAQNPKAIDEFLNRYADSVEYVNHNVSEAAALVGEYEIIPEAVAEIAIPYCNITFIEGVEMKEKLSGYLGVLFEQNPQAVGGVLPSDEFYFSR